MDGAGEVAMTVLYRYFDCDGCLLYVGVTDWLYSRVVAPERPDTVRVLRELR